jgi:AraC family transcriptional regulator of adaptative response / DNA-3-methyladenine glycosylase II
MTIFSAVTTTGIYCRPGCPATPLARNVRHFALPAAAEAAGFRACLRCRPYRSDAPISWAGSELVCRAVQLVVDGALDGGTEEQLGVRLGVSARHLRRLFDEHVGLTPDQLARSRRTHFARRLLDDTDLSVADIAFAAGFGSVRQLNRASREVFRSSPSELRARRRRSDRLVADGGLCVRMPFVGALDWSGLLAWFAARAVPGVEVVDASGYRRTVVIDGDPGVVEVSRGGPDHLVLRAHLPHWEGLIHVVQRARRIFALDADPDGPAALDADPLLAARRRDRPGVRVPGTWDPFETGVRAIVARRLGGAGASAVMARLVRLAGTPVGGLGPLGLTHLFPSPAALATAELGCSGLAPGRASAVRAFARAVAGGTVRLDRSVGLGRLVDDLVALPGVGPSTAQHLAWRLGEPDAFPAGDVRLRAALADPGATLPSSRDAEVRAERWRPWRAQAAALLCVVDPAAGDPGRDAVRSTRQERPTAPDRS